MYYMGSCIREKGTRIGEASLPPHQLEQITCSHDNPQVMPNSTLIYLYLPPGSSKSKLTNTGRQRETKNGNNKRRFEDTS
jgi:hypothetical protein